MKSYVSEEIFRMFPHYIRNVIIAKCIQNTSVNKSLADELNQCITKTGSMFNAIELTTHPQIINWRKAYSTLGMKGSQFYSSVEALARRARRDGYVPYINTLVAIMNLFSLRNLVPCGGDDIDAIKGDVALRLAEGNEIFSPLNSREIENPIPGEAIYVDSQGIVLCRRWNWRQGNITKISGLSKNVIINIDCLHPVEFDRAKELTLELVEMVKIFCNPTEIKCDFLYKENPIVTF